ARVERPGDVVRRQTARLVGHRVHRAPGVPGVLLERPRLGVVSWLRCGGGADHGQSHPQGERSGGREGGQGGPSEVHLLLPRMELMDWMRCYLMPVMAMPCMMCRWRTRKIAITGITTTTAPASS